MEVITEQLQQLAIGLQDLTALVNTMLAAQTQTTVERTLPAVLQCAAPHRAYYYSSTGSLTFCQAGCLVTALYSLAYWAGYRPDEAYNPLLEFAQRLDAAGCFSGNYLQHPSKVEKVVPSLKWHPAGDVWLAGGHISLLHWRNTAADLGVLQTILEQQPVIAEVDYTPGVTTDANWHFVVIEGYVPDPDGGQLDDCIIMDPMAGGGASLVAGYFRSTWLRDGSMHDGRTRVQRVLTGLRAWEFTE